MDTIVTNEWLSVEGHRLPINRDMLVRAEYGNLFVARWNGFYWVNSNTGFRHQANGLTPNMKITHFYMFEKFNQNEVL